VSDENRSECFQNLPCADPEFPDVNHILHVSHSCQLVHLGLSKTISASGHMRRHRAVLQYIYTFLRKRRVRQPAERTGVLQLRPSRAR
jgi:hypothetical protein